ncbi:MAG: hypothetical protein V6Z81_05125 [Parvularculales bacterium]
MKKIIFKTTALLPAVWVFIVAQGANFAVALVLLCLVLLATYMAYLGTRLMAKTSISEGAIDRMYRHHESYSIPYLISCVLAFLAPDAFVFVLLLIIFWLLVPERTSYMNPLLHLFGYHFFIISSREVESVLITQYPLRFYKGLEFMDLRKFDDDVFIDMDNWRSTAMTESTTPDKESGGE